MPDETAEEEAKTLEAAEGELELALMVFEGDAAVAGAEGFAVDVTATAADETEIKFTVPDLTTDEGGKLAFPLVDPSRIPSMDSLKWTEVTPEEGQQVSAWTSPLTANVTLPGAYSPAESKTLTASFVINRTLKPAEEPEPGADPPAPEYDYTIAPQEPEEDG